MIIVYFVTSIFVGYALQPTAKKWLKRARSIRFSGPQDETDVYVICVALMGILAIALNVVAVCF